MCIRDSSRAVSRRRAGKSWAVACLDRFTPYQGMEYEREDPLNLGHVKSLFARQSRVNKNACFSVYMTIHGILWLEVPKVPYPADSGEAISDDEAVQSLYNPRSLSNLRTMIYATYTCPSNARWLERHRARMSNHKARLGKCTKNLTNIPSWLA